MFYSESQSHVTGATKRPAIALKDDNDDDEDDDDCATCPSTLSDREPPEVVRRLEKNADDELVLLPSAKSPTGSGFQLLTSSSGVAAPPSLSAYRSAGRFLVPPPSATAFQLAAFHNIYVSQQQQQQLRHNHHISPHLRFSVFTDASSAPGMQHVITFSRKLQFATALQSSAIVSLCRFVVVCLFVTRVYSINQYFLEWPKWQATARTTTGVTVNVTEYCDKTADARMTRLRNLYKNDFRYHVIRYL